MWTDFNNSFTFGFVDKLRNTQNKIFHRTWILLPHYLVKFKCLTVQRYIPVMYAVLDGLMCTGKKWANYRSWQFSNPFTAKTMLWTVIDSFAGRLL